MKKIFKLTCLLGFSLIAAGCGKKGIVPEKTVVAAFIDLEKAYEDGKSVVKAVINELPDKERSEAIKGYEQALKQIDRYKDPLNPKWAVIAFGGDLASLGNSRKRADHVAVAFKVDTDEATVDRLAKDFAGSKMCGKGGKNEGGDSSGSDEEEPATDKRKEGKIYTLRHEQGYIGLIDDKYLIFSRSKDAFYDMFDLYAGKCEPSKDFGDLTRISGNTICRISTAPISSLLRRFELAREVERFGEDCDDEDLADMILNMGAVSLDIGADGEDVDLTLRVACGSSGDAKILDCFFQSIAFSSRVAFDVGAYVAKDPDRSKDMRDGIRGLYDGISRLSRTISTSTDTFIALSRAVEAERDGSTAILSCVLGTEKLAKLISDRISDDRKPPEKKASANEKKASANEKKTSANEKKTSAKKNQPSTGTCKEGKKQ